MLTLWYSHQEEFQDWFQGRGQDGKNWCQDWPAAAQSGRSSSQGLIIIVRFGMNLDELLPMVFF